MCSIPSRPWCDRLDAKMPTSAATPPSPTSPPATSPSPHSGSGDGRPVAQHLAGLEARLAGLEDLLTQSAVDPAGPLPQQVRRRLAGLEAREHHHAQALAGLEARLAALLAHLSDDSATPSASDHRSHQRDAAGSPLVLTSPKPSLPRRLLAGLHYLRYVWRRLKGAEDGPFPDRSLRLLTGPDVRQLPVVGLVLIDDGVPTDVLRAAIDRQTDLAPPCWLYGNATGVLHHWQGDGAPSQLSLSVDGLRDHLRQSTAAPYLLSATADEVASWPPTLVECLRLTLAVEELDLLEILLPASRRLLVRRHSDWSPPRAGVSALLERPKADAIGKVIRLTPEPLAALLDRCFERRSGPYRFARSGASLRRHRLVVDASKGPSDSDQRPPLPITSHLLGGREQLFSELLLRLGSGRLVLTSGTDPLTLERFHHLQRLRRLDGSGSQIYPLASFLEPPDLDGAVAWLARHLDCPALLPLADDPAELPTGAAQAAGIPCRQAPRHRAGFVLCDDLPGDGRRSAEAAIEALRQQLGLSPRVPVVLWLGDLLPERRPEDFLTLAKRWQGAQDPLFLMVGRGPLEGSIDDLARFLGLPRFRRLPSLPLAFAIALCDVVCLTASQEPLPYGLLAALGRGRPVLLPGPSQLADWIDSLGAGASFDGADPDAPVRALARLLETRRRTTDGGTPEDEHPGRNREELAVADHDGRWRDALHL